MAAAIREIPLFPLSTVVLLPGLRVPLHIFEPRYRQMMEAALAGDRTLGMIAVPPAVQGEMAGNPRLYDSGCAGFIERWERLADGRYHLVLEGTERFRILEEREPEGDRLFRIARVEALEERAAGDADGVAARRRAVIDLLRPLAQRPGSGMSDVLARLESLEDDRFANTLCLSLGLPCEERQLLLEASGPCERLERLAGVLEFHLARTRSPAGDGSGRVH